MPIKPINGPATTEQATPAAQPTVNAAAAKEVAKSTVEAQASVELHTNNENLGIMSDKVAFVAPLGDPSTPDITPADESKGIARKSLPTIVGYRMKALVDMTVPDCGTGADFKKNRMSFDESKKNNRKAVKAGETFDMTPFEIGMLLSPVEFNGKATGGEIPVTVAYQFYKSKSKDGEPAKMTKRIPAVSLRAMNKGQSIKDVDMIPVLTFTANKTDTGRTTSKDRKIIPGFEKWAPLCVTQAVGGSRTGSSTSEANLRNKNADMFLSIVGAMNK